jgi:hypothetical protein
MPGALEAQGARCKVNGKDIRENFLKAPDKNLVPCTVDLEPGGHLRRNEERAKLASLWMGNAADDPLMVDQGESGGG